MYLGVRVPGPIAPTRQCITRFVHRNIATRLPLSAWVTSAARAANAAAVSDAGLIMRGAEVSGLSWHDELDSTYCAVLASLSDGYQKRVV